MLFNSYVFIFFFLPACLTVYFFLNRKRLTAAAKACLVSASLLFYGWWNIKYLPLIVGSILFNYAVGTALSKRRAEYEPGRKAILFFGICMNVALLGYFKYVDFFIGNINFITNAQIPLLKLVLPLGISFFTFTQIAYLVDAYRSEAKEYDFLNYSLFVTFFPHLLAGPIIHHKEMMPQFDRMRNKVVNHKNIAMGLLLFSIGLFKKQIIADTFALWANSGFDTAPKLTLLEGWATSLSYTFQLYFDFSGYTDMALGSALMFNIKLPINFNSPYKALNIQDFWRRWHITLSRFLREYIYIPLGGNRLSESRTLFNLLITFLIGGLWHGAGWTFVFWGFLHGIGVTIHRVWRIFNISMPKALAWLITFNFVNIAWIFFRAKSWKDARKVLEGMFGVNGVIVPEKLAAKLAFLREYGIEFGAWLKNINISCDRYTLMEIMMYMAICFLMKNSNELVKEFRPTGKYALFISILIVISVLNLNRTSEFIYFNF